VAAPAGDGHLSSPPRPAIRRAAVPRHAGNPFYLIELLKTMFAQGLLAKDEKTGEWTVAPEVAAPPASAGVADGPDVIAERVTGCPTSCATC